MLLFDYNNISVTRQVDALIFHASLPSYYLINFSTKINEET